MSRILIIGAGWEQEELIKEAKKQGHFIVATHPIMDNTCLSLADKYFIKDSRDISFHLKIAKAYDVDGVLTDNCDYSYFTACIINEKLGLKDNILQSAIYSNNKLAQRNACKLNNIRQPDFYIVQTISDLLEASEKLSFPVILKPIDNRGTFGITIINQISELENAFYDAISNSISRVLICEKFIEGTLITVDGFCFKDGHKSLTVASRKFEKGSKPITKEIIYPALLKEEQIIMLKNNHEKVVEALNYKLGHTHGEYIYSNNGEIFLVECTNRGGGVYTSSSIVPFLSGINLNLLLINQALNKDEYLYGNGNKTLLEKSVILTFLDFSPGKVIKSINYDELIELNYVLKFRTIYKKNEMVESIDNCASRHSMLVVVGQNFQETTKNLDDFKNKIKIKYHQYD